MNTNMQQFMMVMVISLALPEVAMAQTIQEQKYIDPVQQQLEAYNNRKIEAFLSPYHDSVRVYLYPRTLQYQGKETMRKMYSGMFQELPDLQCKLVNRIVMGNTVIDHELVTRFKNVEPMEVVAIYRIWEGQIEEVTFIFKNQP